MSANKIGTSGFTYPLDLAGGSISLTTTGAGTYIGSGAVPANPVTAATPNLTINAAGVFNVDTTSVDISNLTVTATPSTVGAGGIAQVTPNGTIYDFTSDGTNFSLSNWTAPAAQFFGGTLSFTSTAGDITLANIDLGASWGSLSSAHQAAGQRRQITQTPGSTLDLRSGSPDPQC